MTKLSGATNQKVTTAESFDADLKASEVVMVKFTAEWCAPCRAIQPAIDAVVQERRDVTVLHVDVDAEQRLAERFAVRTVPMMFVFRGGRPVGQMVGNASRATLEKLLR